MKRYLTRLNILAFLIIGLIIAGCSKDKNNERKALSHCADIKYINHINSNPQLIVNKTRKSEIIEEIQNREVAVQKWMKENNITKDLMGGGKASAKFADLSDPINFKLYRLFNKVIAETISIQSLNEKTMDYKVEHKKKEYVNYAEYHLQCWNVYKSENGYYSKQFIDKYLEWQKQDISNLLKQSYDFLNEMLLATNNTSYSNEFRDHFVLLLITIRPSR